MPLRTPISLRTILQVLAVLGLGTLLIVYTLFQARNMIQGPKIILDEPYDQVVYSRTNMVHGTAKNIVKMTLNGKEIHTNKAGEFSHELILENGYTLVTLEAWDRFGRKSAHIREYVFVNNDAKQASATNS